MRSLAASVLAFVKSLTVTLKLRKNYHTKAVKLPQLSPCRDRLAAKLPPDSQGYVRKPDGLKRNCAVDFYEKPLLLLDSLSSQKCTEETPGHSQRSPFGSSGLLFRVRHHR